MRRMGAARKVGRADSRRPREAAHPDGLEEVPGYTHLERIGGGGFSVVYRAYQERFDRTVALKVLHLDTMDDRDLRRLRSECQLAGRLTGHPNIVTVLETGTTRSGRPFLAMEHFEGGSLGDRLAREGPLPLPDVLRTGVKIAGALAAAHAIGIVHRDVKPENLLVSRYGEPALTDFGISTLVGAGEGSARWSSLTPYHVAPEVLDDRDPDAASDVYSLGSTLYQLLAGRPAHSRGGEDALAPLLLRILSEDPPDIARADLPPQVMPVIRRAMARTPDERFPDARALADELRRLQGELGLPVTDLVPAGAEPAALPPGSETRWDLHETIAPPPRSGRPDEREAPPRRGRPPVLIAAAVVAVLGLGLGVGVDRLLHGPAPAPSPGPSRPAQTPTATAVPADVLEAARPTGLTVVDNGGSAVLHWKLGDGNDYPLFVQRTRDGGQSTLSSIGNGVTTTTVEGLDPHAGYCFLVGAGVRFEPPSATVAWSTPVCIRGAAPQPSTARSPAV